MEDIETSFAIIGNTFEATLIALVLASNNFSIDWYKPCLFND